MASKDLIIYGAGGLGREILSLVRSLDAWNPCGFVDDGLEVGLNVAGLTVLGGKDFIASISELTYVVLAIGDPGLKRQVFHAISNPMVRYPSLIHPSVIIQDLASTTIGQGSVITAGCILTTDIVIGNHVLINLNTTIGHDVAIGDYSSVMPGVNIAGQVEIGKAVLVGSGTNVLNGVVIGGQSKIGMGSVVIKNVPEKQTVAGVPAKNLHL